jgi:pyrimidine operon attenuation protein / uracil phosphoribosyltransferase
MNKSRTLLLSPQQISQRIDRIAYQIYEDNADETEIVIVGIKENGYIFAERVREAVIKTCDLKPRLIGLRINKHDQVSNDVELTCDLDELSGKSIVLVDDVLNSGKTLIYAMKALLKTDTKKIRTALLVDRDHRRYPVLGDFVGITLSTTFQEHVSVEFGENEGVFLS